MTLPFSLPDWMPAWLGLVLLLVALLYALALLAMPFSVFGVKSRLEAIETQLDAVQEELRILTMRLPEPLRGVAIDESPYDPLPRASAPRYAREPDTQPPLAIPPAPEAAREPLGRSRPSAPPSRSSSPPPPRRIEPRLD
ncbi:hypothetical protein AiwAL_07505 [Acidiphilium sp. AL]|uniref:Uncharacterized protein n=1 Tax=Acidiphilium iwatense TaxID=768198 RepID=A0ABS9DV84_9PROT|nr:MULTISPECIES: hypothetical protein [Acidiphilium]MCF3946627.1 hypothetical protein [Acidiphilium iwatense]MCU4159952.1 hypothetical protein [Acidiphilium sp. AL]